MTETKSGLPILTFASAETWEAWLAEQPRSSGGLWLKIAKKKTGAASLSKNDAIDGALVHGWIDGQLYAYDDVYFLTRFTPRRAKSKWSKLNRQRAERLLAERRMTPAGLAEVEAAKADGRWERAYPPQSAATVPPDLRAALAAAPAARKFFEQLDGANRYAILYRLHGAKTAATRAARLEKFVAMLARGETIHPPRGKQVKRAR
jgi:uncharacterized protein YdeI (YjbR/CyaY-like superfamily)